MNQTSMTTMKVKEINKRRVYQTIYQAKTTCKLHITQQLQMGLSTVTQNLKLLEEEGLIQKNGYFDSTGGRKADALEIVATARIAIGVALLQKTVHIVATDLYGQLLHSHVLQMEFGVNSLYFENLASAIGNFIAYHQLDSHHILGVSIATQGIVSHDGTTVTYGEILGNTAMELSDLAKHIPYPCRLEHDSKAAATLELWHHPHVRDGVVLLLNHNMGGAVVVDGSVHKGSHMRSGTVEHLTVKPQGEVCYCGKRGCLETCCSGNSLTKVANMEIIPFFELLHKDDGECSKIWGEYLHYLALAIANLSVIIDGTFVISGQLAPYFSQKDLDILLEIINDHATFPVLPENLVLGTSGQFTQAMGASLYYINQFLFLDDANGEDI